MTLSRGVPAESGVGPSAPPVVLREVRLGPGGDCVDVRVEDGIVSDIGPSVVRRPGEPDVRLAGATLLPGFVDAHVHSKQWARSRMRIDVSGARSPQEAIELIGLDLAGSAGPADVGKLVMGHGFRNAFWTEAAHKDQLERAMPGAVVAVVSHDLHELWVSPAALALLGRDHPTGVLSEQDAMVAKTELEASVSTETTDQAIRDLTVAAAAQGVTQLTDFEFADNYQDWQRRLSTGDTRVRVLASVWTPWLEHAIELGLRTQMPVPGTQGLLEVGPYKVVADGSLNTRSAYCHESYPSEDGAAPHVGELLIAEDELVDLMSRAWRAGLEPAVHAIGDHANTIALNAFERVGCTGRIEHAQLVRSSDLRRFAQLGVVASVQPQHAVGDRDVADRYWAGRTQLAFPYAGLLAAGARLELGSDAPVADSRPLQAIADSVRRTDDERPPWHPEQAIPAAAALKAAVGGRPVRVRVGARADLTVLAAGPTEVAASDIADIPVLGTLLGGRITHSLDGGLDPDG